MIKHYLTVYVEKDNKYAESWLQINLFGKTYCFSKKRVLVGYSHGSDNRKATCELSSELEKREGIEKIVVYPYEEYEIKTEKLSIKDSGPAIILVNKD